MKHFIKHLFFLTLLTAVKSYGADSKTYSYYDSLTYNLYNHQQWEKLTIAGNEALNEGYDYYYLRTRIGIAYFRLKNYRLSITHFRKALLFNSADPAIIEYIYIALIESGQQEEATLLASKHKELLTSAGIKKKPLEFIYTEGGYTPDASSGNQARELMKRDSVYGEEDSYTGQTYFHAGAGMHILPSLTCYLGYSNLGIDKEKHIAGSTFINHLDSTSVTDTIIAYFSPYRKIFDTLIPYNVKQHEFYFSANWIPLPGLSITPAFHYISGTTQSFTAAYQIVPDTAFVLAFGSTWPINYLSSSRYVVSRQQSTFSNYVVSLAASMEWRNFSFGINGSYANLATSGKQKQAGASVTWFPSGNLNLYATTSLTGFFYKKDKRLILNQSLGGKIAPKLWLEGMLTLGNLSLYNEKNAFIAYNLTDRIKLRTGANLTILLSRHLALSLMYRYYSKENDYLYYLKSQPLVPETGTTKYTNHSLTGGLKWKL